MEITDVKTYDDALSFIGSNSPTEAQLRQIVSQLQAEIPSNIQGKTSAILYSGMLSTSEHSGTYAEAIANADSSVAILNKTEAYKLLDDFDFEVALRNALGDPQDPVVQAQAKNILDGTTDVNGTRTPNGLWDDISSPDSRFPSSPFRLRRTQAREKQKRMI